MSVVARKFGTERGKENPLLKMESELREYLRTIVRLAKLPHSSPILSMHAL